MFARAPRIRNGLFRILGIGSQVKREIVFRSLHFNREFRIAVVAIGNVNRQPLLGNDRRPLVTRRNRNGVRSSRGTDAHEVFAPRQPFVFGQMKLAILNGCIRADCLAIKRVKFNQPLAKSPLLNFTEPETSWRTMPSPRPVRDDPEICQSEPGEPGELRLSSCILAKETGPKLRPGHSGRGAGVSPRLTQTRSTDKPMSVAEFKPSRNPTRGLGTSGRCKQIRRVDNEPCAMCRAGNS